MQLDESPRWRPLPMGGMTFVTAARSSATLRALGTSYSMHPQPPPKVTTMHRIQHVFLRGALALGLMAVGIAGGLGYDQAYEDAHCPAKRVALQAAIRHQASLAVSVGDTSSRNTAQADCRRGNV